MKRYTLLLCLLPGLLWGAAPEIEIYIDDYLDR